MLVFGFWVEPGKIKATSSLISVSTVIPCKWPVSQLFRNFDCSTVYPKPKTWRWKTSEFDQTTIERTPRFSSPSFPF